MPDIHPTKTSIKDIPQEQWDGLAGKKIYFGHQSVGNNIIDGINKVIAQNGQVQLEVEETIDIPLSGPGVLAHSRIGENHKPYSKVDDFKAKINSGLGSLVDIAGFKFCFVDIDAKTQITDVFSYYQDAMSTLATQYPDTLFYHMTIPLLKREKRNLYYKFKSLVKTILGKKEDNFFADEHNIARNKYNQLLMDTYGGKEPIFDIAKLESTLPDGSRAVFEQDNKSYYYLYGDYTNDAGHLNNNSRLVVAEQFLVFLANIQR